MLISNIPTSIFNQIILELRSEQWRQIAEYTGFDAWIDYGMIVLKKQGIKLKFEWNNWEEGSIQGANSLLRELQEKYKLN